MTSVFIVDDQATNRLLLSKLASSIEADVEVAAFGDPVRALAECGHRAPDLIISDYKMGPMSGAEFICRLRAMGECHDIPIMVLTAYDERTFRMAALEAGATDFLLSPIDHGEFLRRARNLLQLRKQQKVLESRATVLADELLQSERAREEIVRNDREVLAQVIDTVPAFIMAADPLGRCIFVNASQARHAGGPPAEYVGQPVARLLGNRAELALEQDREDLSDRGSDAWCRRGDCRFGRHATSLCYHQDTAARRTAKYCCRRDYFDRHHIAQGRRGAGELHGSSRCVDRAP